MNPLTAFDRNIFFHIISDKQVPNIFAAENNAIDPLSISISQTPIGFFSSFIMTCWNLIIRYRSTAPIESIAMKTNQKNEFCIFDILLCTSKN